MVPKLVRKLDGLKAYLALLPSQRAKLLNCNGSPGSRATPPPVHDERLGLRVHYGRKVFVDGIEHQEYHLLLNKNAQDRTIRELANKNPNKKWATASIPTKAEDRKKDNDEVINDLIGDLKDDINDGEASDDDTPDQK